jgi:tetratricopeptide (TPR) repeat protein
MDDLESRLASIREKAKRGEYESALELCAASLEVCPNDYRVLRERAYVYERMGDLAKAIDDISLVIGQRPRDPAFLFERSLWWLNEGNYDQAIADTSEVLRLCDEWRNDYYREIAHFFRAYAALKLSRPSDALADCKQVRDDCCWWIQGALCKRSDLVDEANALLAKQNK